MGKFKKGFIVLLIIEAAIFCWFAEKIAGSIISHPKAITGTSPTGAAEVVKITAKKEAGFFKRIRKSLGKYMRIKYPASFRKFKKVF